MICIFHRGYFGFQPEVVTGEVTYSFTQPKLTNFISNGRLRIPISGDDLDQTQLGSMNKIDASYKVSRKIYFRVLYWEENNPEDRIFIKATNEPEGANPSYRCIPLDTAHNTSAVLSQSSIDGEYLTALIHADATLDQIDAFVQEYLVGSYKPFVWTPYTDVCDLIKASVGKPIKYPFTIKREGPSRERLVAEVMNDIKERLKDEDADPIVDSTNVEVLDSYDKVVKALSS